MALGPDGELVHVPFAAAASATAAAVVATVIAVVTN